MLRSRDRMRQEKEWFPAYLADVSVNTFLALAFVGTLAWGLWQQSLTSRPLRRMNAAAQLFKQKRYAESEARFRKIIASRPTRGVEADARYRLSYILDFLGRAEEAAMERERSLAAAAGAVKDPLALMVHGDLLSREQRWEEALIPYTKSLALAATGRTSVLKRLARAQYNARHSEGAAASAEGALKGRLAPTERIDMHRLAGNCLARQGLLEEAETHLQQSLALAEEEKDHEEVSDILTDLARVQHRRGQFAEAISMCQRAGTIHSGPLRYHLSVEATCFSCMGQYDQARAVMERYRQGPVYPQPNFERLIQAYGSLSSAWIEAGADCPDAALTHLVQAREGLRTPSTSTTWPPPPLAREHSTALLCDVTEAYAQAQLGQVEQAQRLAANVEARLPQVEQDRDTRLTVYSFLASAAFKLDDFVESRRLWTLYMDCGPDPIGLPGAYLELGEIALRLGDAEEAQWAFEQAVAPGIDSLDARRAEARLNEMGGDKSLSLNTRHPGEE